MTTTGCECCWKEFTANSPQWYYLSIYLSLQVSGSNKRDKKLLSLNSTMDRELLKGLSSFLILFNSSFLKLTIRNHQITYIYIYSNLNASTLVDFKIKNCGFKLLQKCILLLLLLLSPPPPPSDRKKSKERCHRKELGLRSFPLIFFFF